MANSKKPACFATAEHLYVTQQLQLTEIASQLRVSERTLVTWKKEGSWERKKSEFLAESTSFHLRLMHFAGKVMDKIEKDWDTSQDVAPGRLYALKGILDKIPKVKGYEDEVHKENADEQLFAIPAEALKNPKVREAMRTITEIMREHQ